MTRGPLAAALGFVLMGTLRGFPNPPPVAIAGENGGKVGVTVMDLPAIKRALKGSRARVVVVHFWATWCFPCLEELPMVDKFAREAKARGVEVLSLSLDDPEQGGARVDDPDAFIGSFGSWEGSIPAVFAYDASGQLRGELYGETTRRALDELVGRVLKSTERPAR